jgi:hypothetical protein
MVDFPPDSGMARRVGELCSLVLLLIFLGCDRPPTDHHVRVIEVLDGDDIVVRLPGEGDVNIRYIGSTHRRPTIPGSAWSRAAMRRPRRIGTSFSTNG